MSRLTTLPGGLASLLILLPNLLWMLFPPRRRPEGGTHQSTDCAG